MRIAPAGLLLLTSTALAQNLPLQTEPATTAAGGTLVLETAGQAVGEVPNPLTGDPRTVLDMPLLRLVYSPAKEVELDLEWIGQVIAVNDPAFGDVSDWGDVTLRAKWCFAAEKPDRPALAVRFAVSLPETDFTYGLGPNTLRMRAEALLSKQLGRTTVHLNLGFATEDHPLGGPSQSDFVAYGAALEQPVAPGVVLVGEVAGLGAGDGRPGTERRGEARFGLRCGRGRVVADAALIRGVEVASGRWGVIAGLSWRIKPRG